VRPVSCAIIVRIHEKAGLGEGTTADVRTGIVVAARNQIGAVPPGSSTDHFWPSAADQHLASRRLSLAELAVVSLNIRQLLAAANLG